MPEPAAPTRRGWRKPRAFVPIATAAAALSLGAGSASAQDGGVAAGEGGSGPPSSTEPAPAGDFTLQTAAASPRKSYFDGLAPPTIAYTFSGSAPTDVRIDVLSETTGAVVDTIVDPAAAPNTQNTAIWDGIGADGARAANGRYTFRVAMATAAAARRASQTGFGFYSHRFPLAAKHGYGDGYGAGRDHEGQDVFARCGKSVMAARGGRVQVNKTHSAAGNYVVIDGRGTGTDYMYAHLESRSPLPRGSRVHTGEEIGRVGATGNASDCHLHFEVWSAPGWYEGGQPLPSVRRLLKSWDTWS